MKKLLIGILIPVTVLVGGAATLFFMIRDTSSVKYQKTGYTDEEVLNKRLAESISDTGSTHKISYCMNQDDFNQIISLSYDKLDSSAKEYLKGLEIQIKDGTYHIYVYAKASILSSKLDISCKFNQDDENYYLDIESIKAGALPVKSIAFLVLKNALPESQINTMFEDAGLSLKADYSKKRFVYNKNEAKNDLVSLLKKNMSENELVSSLAESLFASDLFSLDFTSGIAANIDLEPLNTNVNFCSSSNEIKKEDYAIEDYKKDVLTLLDNGTIDMSNGHVQTVFTYLVKGYSYLSDTEKQYIDSLNLSSIGLDTEFWKKNHIGYIPSTSWDIQGEITSAINDKSLIGEDGLLIKEASLNSYLQSQGLLGYNYVFASKEENSYILNYIVLDNAYFNLIDKDGKEQMNMVLGISINGYETSLILENTKKENLSYGMSLKNENIYFGNKEVNEPLKNSLYSLIQDNLSSNEFLSFDGNGNFIINFEGYLKDYIQEVNTVFHKTLVLDSSIQGKSLEDENAGILLLGSLK